MWDKLKKTVKYNDSLGLNEVWDGMKQKLATAADNVKEIGSGTMPTVLPFLQIPDLLKWTKSLTEASATAYDKAMDAEYLKTHIGGGEHRLYDGGHTILGSWGAVKESVKNDEIKDRGTDEQIIGWAEAYFKDLTTTMGMPFYTVDKANFDQWVEAVVGTIPGVDRRYLYDLMSFDALEILAAGISVVGVFFAFKNEDKERLAEILGAMGISSTISANPILGLMTIAVTAYSYWKHGNVDMASMLRGGGMTAISATMFSIMGLPILVELVIVVTLMTLLKKQIINNEDFVGWLKTKIEESLQGPKKFLNVEGLNSILSR